MYPLLWLTRGCDSYFFIAQDVLFKIHLFLQAILWRPCL